MAHKKECGGSENSQGRVGAPEACASKCRGKSSMFALGTNDYLTNRCTSSGCTCLCETAAKSDGTCIQVNHKGYRLYKYEKGIYHVFGK